MESRKRRAEGRGQRAESICHSELARNLLCQRSNSRFLPAVGMTTLLVFAMALVAGCALLCAPVSADQIAVDTAALCRGSHRLLGTKENAAAADYVVSRLNSIRPDKVTVQRFPAVQLEVKRCDLTLKTPTGSKKLRLQPMRPDGIIAPVSPPEGITGQLLNAHNGTLREYGNRSPRGKIVVLDYNTTDAWKRAFRLGAKAVIFVRNGRFESSRSHYTDAPANLPRYYYPGNPADLVEATAATIHCEAQWKQVRGRNVIAYIRGTDPVLNKEMGREIVVLGTPIDSYGEVPELSPGARGAANCAALLEITRYLVKNRPKRDILAVWFDGQAYGHAGASAFYRALERKVPEIKTENRQKFVQYEQKLLEQMAAALQKDELPPRQSPVYAELLKRLKMESADRVFKLNVAMEDLRKIESRLKKSGEQSAELTRVTADLAAKQKIKDRWNNLRRSLAHDEREKLKQADLVGLFAQTAAKVRADIVERRAELREAAEDLKSDKALNDIMDGAWITLHASLLLGDSSPRWGLLIGGDSTIRNVRNENPGHYSKIQNTFLAAYQSLAGSGRVSHFDTATVDGNLTPRLFWPGPLIHGGEVGGRYGIYSLAMGTVHEKLPMEGTPDDTLAGLRTPAIAQQASEIAAMIHQAGSMEGLSLRRSIVANTIYHYPKVSKNGAVEGVSAVGVSGGSAMPNQPLPHTVVQLNVQRYYITGEIFLQGVKTPGFNHFQVLMTDANGIYAYGPVGQGYFEPMVQGFAAKFDDRGEVVAVSTKESRVSGAAEIVGVNKRLVIFPCVKEIIKDGKPYLSKRYGAALLGPKASVSPILISGDPTIMRAISNSPLEMAKANFGVKEGILYWYCDQSVDGVKVFGQQSMVALHSGGQTTGWKGSPSEALGKGLSMLGEWEFPWTSVGSAFDMWRVDESRLNILRSKGIVNPSVEELHGRAEDLLIGSEKTDSVAEKEAAAASAYLAEDPVYTSTKTALGDLVQAVLILLALAIPFAFALERLLIGAVNIYRQIAWFGVFFALTFLILFFVHPAFAVSAQPIIIFLAFVLMVLSGLVIFIIMQRFESELKAMQGMGSTVHTADVSRLSTMMAAVAMGISTMRRRPLRTALTALTITLLTFTILNFASFDTATGLVTFFQGPSPSYNGVLIRNLNWDTIDGELLEVLRAKYGEKNVVTGRYWRTDPVGMSGETTVVSRADGSQATTLRAVVGLEQPEISRRPDFRGALGPGSSNIKNGVFLPAEISRRIGVKVGDPVVLCGLRLRVAGVFDNTRLSAVKDLDNGRITPVDFAEMTGSQTWQSQTNAQGTGVAVAQRKQDWRTLPADSIAFVSADTALALGPTSSGYGESDAACLRAICIYTPDTQTSAAIAGDLARVLPMPVIATRSDGAYTHILAPTFTAKGVKDLIFPIILGALVIFGTMLGSVADREREIYTFSALGLAPPHVATLFFAEAMVYAFIGGMGGYLLAQGMLKLLTFIATFAPVSVPDMNYSSTNAIVTILVVMCTVLVSAIYPARKASRSANPGVMRAWRLPAPEGDVFRMVFPFTVSQYDITGVVSFLKEHFDNYTDTSLGIFMAQDTKLVEEDGSLGLQSMVALAPFDLGVTQDFHLHSSPSDIQGIDEVIIRLVRKSGQQKDWQRLNKVLLDDLRRQFLIWRSLPHETMETYRLRTLTAMGKGTSK